MYKRQAVDTIRITRFESERIRIRKTSTKGTDLGIVLSHGSKLQNGDVLLVTNDVMIVVEIEPENVGVIKMKPNTPSKILFKLLPLIGHMIGNLHRPMQIKDDNRTIYFPIYSDEELDNFKKSLLPNYFNIEKKYLVFEPNGDIHAKED